MSDKLMHRIMMYCNNDLILRTQHAFRMKNIAAYALVNDLMLFLALHVYEKVPKGQKHFTPPPKIDEVWHLFILDTDAYREFCDKVLQRYVPHQPYLIRKGSLAEQRHTERMHHTVEMARQHSHVLTPNWAVPRIPKPRKRTPREEVPVC